MLLLLLLFAVTIADGIHHSDQYYDFHFVNYINNNNYPE